jgi:hypothetical protein
MKNLILVLPSFFNNSGHENAFINSYKIISIQKKYLLHLIIAENNDLKIPGNIYKIAPKINYNKFFFLKFIKSFFLIFIFFFRLLKIVKKIGRNNKNYYLIDGCSFFYFLSLLLLFLRTGKQTKLLYYLREDLDQKPISSLIFSIFINLCKKLFFDSVIIITDNDPLEKKLQKKYTLQILKLPIPHIFKSKKNNYKRFDKIIWLPGPFRQDKGKNNVIKFLQNNQSEDFLLKINKNFNIINSKVSNVSNSLTRQKYEFFFKKVSTIILPYNCPSYQYRTSGIFVESVIAGKLLFVSRNTWMAEELKKFKLKQLIVKDWGKLSIKEIKNIFFNKNILHKINKMSFNYANYHNKSTFIKKLSNAL